MYIRDWFIKILLVVTEKLLLFTDFSSFSSALRNKNSLQGVLDTESTITPSSQKIKTKLTWHSEPNECVGIRKTKVADGEHSIFLSIYHWKLKLGIGHHARSSHYEQMLYDLSVPMILHD